MSNIHGFSSLSIPGNRIYSLDDETNNRYVGGVNSRGGGSGLEVEPESYRNNVLDSIRSQAKPTLSDTSEQYRTVTMYRNGFTVDSGPFRRLDDPSNAPFLIDLAKGRTPKELEANIKKGEEDKVIKIGLIDKRFEDYDDQNNKHDSFQSFSGIGTSLGCSTISSSNTGVITPGTTYPTTSPLDENRPFTSIQVRLMNGNRLVKRVNVDNPVSVLVEYVIQATGNDVRRPFVLTCGFPPRVLTEFGQTIEESQLKGSQVTQRAV